MRCNRICRMTKENRSVARAIGRSKSTISRELSRHRLPSRRYSLLHAAGAYQLRRRREARIERDRALRTFVVDRRDHGASAC
jgi:transposase, IS30 family